MSLKDQKAKEYCENNIPSMKQMHLAIGTAFEAGWDAALAYLKTVPSTELLAELYNIHRHEQPSKNNRH